MLLCLQREYGEVLHSPAEICPPPPPPTAPSPPKDQEQPTFDMPTTDVRQDLGEPCLSPTSLPPWIEPAHHECLVTSQYCADHPACAGISLQTFRELQLLQLREIGPEDYDLLMLLNAKPSTKVLTEPELRQVTDFFCAPCDTDTSCAVCLNDMQAGEELCRLACTGRHVFHSNCIGEWLRTASRCCPVDQHDLSTACGSA